MSKSDNIVTVKKMELYANTDKSILIGPPGLKRKSRTYIGKTWVPIVFIEKPFPFGNIGDVRDVNIPRWVAEQNDFNYEEITMKSPPITDNLSTVKIHRYFVAFWAAYGPGEACLENTVIDFNTLLTTYEHIKELESMMLEVRSQMGINATAITIINYIYQGEFKDDDNATNPDPSQN